MLILMLQPCESGGWRWVPQLLHICARHQRSTELPESRTYPTNFFEYLSSTENEQDHRKQASCME